VQEKLKLNDKDLEVLKFLFKYKMLKIIDASLIYKTKKYYRLRINKLIDYGYVKRYKNYIILDTNGRNELGILGTSYLKNIKNEPYMERLRNIASIATITINSNIEFIPSWDIKDKNKYTESSRKYIGSMIIEDNEYLVYYLTANKQHIFIKQLMFDINKAINNDNIIIFVDNYDCLCEKYSNLSFGKENINIILNNNSSKELIKSYEKIDIHEILQRLYMQEVLISDWEISDYMLIDNTYIVNMLFINTEKITRINWYYLENINATRKIEIVTLKESEEKINELLNDKCTIKVLNKDLLGGLIGTERLEESIM